MALFSATSLYVTLFLIVVLVLGIGQLAYISTYTDTHEQELIQLQLKIDQLSEREQDHIQLNKDQLNIIAQITNKKNQVETQLNETRKELETQLNETRKELETQLNETRKELEITQHTSISQTSTNKLMEIVDNPNNVLTNKDNLIFLLNNFNTYGEIRNADKFTLEENFVPIVIRVYNKHEYFGYAIENYRQIKDINKTMIIVSHDGIFPEMFRLVQTIDFCQVKQIIHPYSGHFLTNRFPGPDASIPDVRDQYNNPRPFPHVSLKHHFWWHMNFVWDQFLPRHEGDMVFMEEDHVPTVDFYLSSKALRTIRNERCPECFNAKIHQHKHKETDIHKVFLSHDLGNVGIIISRARWTQLRNAGATFCAFDDYNWDMTLGHLAAIHAIAPLSLTASVPRAEHMGKCGTHAGSAVCAITQEDKAHFEEVNAQVKNEGDRWENYIFDAQPIDALSPAHRGWGGWGHPMDHQHCIAQIKKIT